MSEIIHFYYVKAYFLAVQHERAPRSTHPAVHHYSLGFGTRFRTLQGFSGIPLNFQNPPLLEPTIGTLSTMSSNYISQGLIYPGMLGAFSKPNGLLAAGLSKKFYEKCVDNIPRFFLDVSNPSYYQKHQPILNPNMSSRNGLKDDEVSSSEEVLQDKSNEGKF